MEPNPGTENHVCMKENGAYMIGVELLFLFFRGVFQGTATNLD
jgi:hypothetical protein